MKWTPDYMKYRKIEDEGRLHLVVMREGSDIVGYLTYQLIKGGPQLSVAREENVYLISALRGTGEHARMRLFAMAGLKSKGVQLITATTKVGHDHRTVLTDLGFEPVDIIYACDLTAFEPPAEET
jgi:hypothetical protein